MLRRDAKVVGIISSGHFFSHFYHLLLPPLFPVFKEVFGVSYTSLAFVIAAASLASVLSQTPLGFLVDRFGGRRILIAGLCCQSLATMLIGLSFSYASFTALVVIAAIANSVYHPADYALLTASVERGRLGRAFSVHTFSGNVGWAVAPGTIIALSALWGWRTAFMALGLLGLLTALYMWSQRGLLRGETRPRPQDEDARPAPSLREGVALLASPPILMALLFFILLAISFGSIRSFSVAALVIMYDTPLATANGALTGLLVGSAAGILAGGVIADRFGRPSQTAALGFVAAAGMIALIGSIAMPVAVLVAVFAAAGFFNGMVQPSRDLLVRQVTPPGSTGKVFGFVSTGFSIGETVMPPIVGWMLDHGDPRWVFWFSAAVLLSALVTVGALKKSGR